MTQPEGQTARDVFPEDEGIPEVSQDDSPTIATSEDPEFAPVPRDDAGASIDFGTTAFEQSEGEPLTQRLERAGFDEVECWLEDRPVQLSDPRDFVTTVCLVRHLDPLPEASDPRLELRVAVLAVE